MRLSHKYKIIKVSKGKRENLDPQEALDFPKWLFLYL